MFESEKNFYPTPQFLIEKMLEDIEWNKVHTILEPSAGKGDIVSGILKEAEEMRQKKSYNYKISIDCIEIDTTLQAALKAQNFRVIHDNFLSFYSRKNYDLIIMNPPIDEGDKHLLKALALQENGGGIICLLNAEIVKNPNSIIQKNLANKLKKLNAKMEFIENELALENENIGVKLVLIKVFLPKLGHDSLLLKNLKSNTSYTNVESCMTANELVAGYPFESLVAHYNLELDAGICIIQELDAIKAKCILDSRYDKLSLKIGEEDCTLNLFIEKTRYKYWKNLLDLPDFNKLLTSDLKELFEHQLEELQHYDFTIFNIWQIRENMMQELRDGMESNILKWFDYMSSGYAYNGENNNIHYYNGWKTNKSWFVNHKVILPLNLFGYMPYTAISKLQDIEKILHYLDKGTTESKDICTILDNAHSSKKVKGIQCTYFTLDFYSKGTCHIKFTNTEVLDKLNIFAGLRRGWLPPSYGKKTYKDMTKEEQDVIQSFHGDASKYENSCQCLGESEKKLLSIL